jgi:hypothetical protein
MTERSTRWPRFEADGAEWEARMVSADEQSDTARDDEVIEFVCVDGSRKARRVVGAGSVADLDEDGLRRAYRSARPIGGDHYGRPGKPARDAP